MNSAESITATFDELVISTAAGDGTEGFSGDGGAATSAELNYPEDLALDSAGNFYIADSSNERIRKVTVSTGDISTVAGDGAEGFSGDGGPATSASLRCPFGVTLDSAGNIYIADTCNWRIRAVNTGTKAVTLLGIEIQPGDIETVAGSSTGVAVDGAGNLYIADSDNYRIRKVSASTGIITTVAGDGTEGYNGDGIAATSAELGQPGGVALDSSGNIYIADTWNYRVRVVNTGATAITVAGVLIQPGDIATIAGNGTAGYNGDEIAATSAELDVPDRVALDSLGNIFISDAQNQRVRRVIASTGIITTVAGDGTAGYSGDGGSAIAAELHSPGGVKMDSNGNLYIADIVNARVRVVKP
jgi:trimeric autotransporter adhesin